MQASGATCTWTLTRARNEIRDRVRERSAAADVAADRHDREKGRKEQGGFMTLDANGKYDVAHAVATTHPHPFADGEQQDPPTASAAATGTPCLRLSHRSG
jgi:hypothetical protein